MRLAVSNLRCYIATAHVSKHRIFIQLPAKVLPDKMLIVIARSDHTTFGVLHSRFHEVWSLGLCTWLGKGNDPRYTPTTTFETFPFPEGILHPFDRSHGLRGNVGCDAPRHESQEQCAVHSHAGAWERSPSPLPKVGRGDFDPDSHFPAIAQAAKNLNQLRESWLNPPQWVEWVQTEEEIEAGFPKRPVAKPGYAAELKQRTLTKLYNQRPAWLDNAHKTLDKAVALAYGWTDYTPEWTDEEILRRLLTLNLERATTQTGNSSGSDHATVDDDLTEGSDDSPMSELLKPEPASTKPKRAKKPKA